MDVCASGPFAYKEVIEIIVILLQPVNDPGGSWFWDMFIGFHLLQFLLYIA